MTASWQESYDKPTQCVKKQRHHFANKVCIVKALVFSVVIYGWIWELYNKKMAERQRIDAFALWCWRRLLGVPWKARRSNKSILKEINPEYSLERQVLKLKLQYFGQLILGKIEGRRRRWQRMRWLDAISDSMDMNFIKLQEMGRDREAWCLQSMDLWRVRHNLETEQQQ